MNIEYKNELIKLIISNLKYRNIEKADFDITAAISAQKVSAIQMEHMQEIGLSLVPHNENKQQQVLVFGLSQLLTADQNTVEGNKTQTKIVEDYKNKHFTVKYNHFMMLGAGLGTIGLAASAALMIATSPLTSIVLGGATIGLACFDNTKHFKKIIAQQLESVLDKKLLSPTQQISLLREKYNSNPVTNTPKLKG